MTQLCFAAEQTLGRLAKWLRILGFDTLYEPDVAANYFRSLEPDRILLTRRAPCRRMRRSENPYVVIQSDHYGDQLTEVIRAAGITVESIRPFSRCNRCNSPIMFVNKSELQGKVPDYIWEVHNIFKICRDCHRIYWAGSHIQRGTERIRELFRG